MPTLAAAPPQAANAKADYLFEVLVRDAQSCAKLIGAVAILVARHAQLQQTGLGPLRHYLNDDSRVSLLALRYAPEAGLPKDLAGALKALYEAVSVAQGELSALIKAKPRPDAVTAVAARWRRLATSARDVLKLAQEPTQRRLEPVFAEDLKALQGFLQEAADGGAARFDAQGVFLSLNLRQRRQAARIHINQPCEISFGDRVAAGEILNLSSTGVGLRCAAPLPAGQTIEVRWAQRHCVAAVVLHHERGMVGARNKRRLTDAEVLAMSKT